MSEKELSEPNFSGTIPVITGTSSIVTSANAYIQTRVSEFKKDADVQVPDMKREFGTDSPSASYSIDIKARLVESEKTHSLVLNTYLYTGGANGISLYKVFTAKKSDDTILTISEVIDPSQQPAFVALIKQKLLAWRPEGSEGIVVFKEDVNALTLSSFSDFAFDQNNLIIYFSKYTIGPGALGATAFPISFSEVQHYVDPFYISTTAVSDTTQKYCFVRFQKATSAAHYESEDHVVFEIEGTQVTGTKRGTQSGPGVQNGFFGELVGTKNGIQIVVLYSYTVEGSTGKEQEEYSLENNILTRKQWPLEEKGGILVPKKTTSPTLLTYTTEQCS